MTSSLQSFGKLNQSLTVPNIGRLRGYLTNESTAIFYGLPFSQTTAGEFRWQKPRDPLPVLDDTVTIDAFKKPKACPQVCEFPSPEYSCPPVEDVSICNILA